MCTKIISNYLIIAFLVNVHGDNWNYKYEDRWPKQCLIGKWQSPINLSPIIAHHVSYPPFEFENYDESYNVVVSNNGHTFEIRLEGTEQPSVTGGGLLKTYVLHSLHFHWKSEHTIENKRYPLELHLVHYDNTYETFTEALSVNSVAVFAIMFYISTNDDKKLSPLYKKLQHLQESHSNTQPIKGRLELEAFLPRDTGGFYRYNGSLTTPDCTEGVTWTIFTNKLPISTKQLGVFSHLNDFDNDAVFTNYRKLQVLNDRTVELILSNENNIGNRIYIFKLTQIFLTIIVLIYNVNY